MELEQTFKVESSKEDDVNPIDVILPEKLTLEEKEKYVEELIKEGKVIVPESSNAYKYEKFIFDYFSYLEKMGVYNVDRELEYEPVKSSAQNAREAYLNKIGGKR